MANLEYFNVKLDSPDGIYRAGQTINGTLMISCPIAIQVKKIGVEMIGETRTHWLKKSSDKSYECYDSHFYEFLDLTSYLSENSDGELLPVGTHQIPFSFALPKNLPSTFANDFGHTSYNCTGKIELIKPNCFLPGCNAIEYPCERKFLVLAATTPGSFLGYDTPMVKEDTSDIFGCCGLYRGIIAISLSLPKTEFVIGSNINGNLTVHNLTRRTLNSLQIELSQHVLLHAEGWSSKFEVITKNFVSVIPLAEMGPVKTGKVENFHLQLSIPDTMLPTQIDKTVCIQYNLNVTVKDFKYHISVPIILTLPSE